MLITGYTKTTKVNTYGVHSKKNLFVLTMVQRKNLVKKIIEGNTLQFQCLTAIPHIISLLKLSILIWKTVYKMKRSVLNAAS